MERCLDTLVAALVLLKNLHAEFQVYLFGPMRSGQEQTNQLPGYEAVKEHIKFFGYTDLKILLPYARKSIAGIALLKPVADYAESYPTKLFEYMALNLPVIASDFPLYQEVIESADCGVCISPYDATKLCEEMDRMIRNPVQSATLGNNGRNAAEQYYTWQNEEKVLLSFYQKISPGKILKN
jgi:glycosyltransferase involved in cell wall biosynthesis